MSSSAFQSPLKLPRSFPCHQQQSTCPLQMATQLDGGITSPKGFKAAGYTAGFKPSGLPDLALVLSSNQIPLTTAAMFTKNLLRAAPVDISEQHLCQSGGKVAAVILNSGQANAGTGTAGWDDALVTAQRVAQEIGCEANHVFLCSTGVIGKRFDIEKMRKAIPRVVAKAKDNIESGTDAANAIMTTDLRRKEVAYEDVIGGRKVVVGGMCKGSGMIHPDMATMLSVVTCDAQVEPALWQRMLKRAVDKSFHAITVDGDTSTNDVVCAMCSGASGVAVDDEGSGGAKLLEELLTKTCVHLAKSIARDGEGATVLLEVHVSGAASDEDARNIAKTVVSSNLTKAAVFGRDPNWGRIAAAAGRANASFDVSDLEISLGGHLLMTGGNPVAFDAAAASKYMLTKSQASGDQYMSVGDTVNINIKVGSGNGTGVAWGCDLSYKYVEINAEYTT